MTIGLSGRRWIILGERNPAPKELIEKYGYVLAQLIYNRREIFNNNLTEDNIDPSLQKLLDPKLFLKLDTTAKKLAEAIKKGKKIAIYGDYDADGITSTALLVNFFRDIGVDVRYYIPSRFFEGYGLNKRAIQKISEFADVLLVVDSGTNAHEELLFAKELGLEVFVLDHHEPLDPNWQAEGITILNPKLHTDIDPLFKHLASVGISFYLLIMLRRLLSLDIKLRPYLDIVAIGTVADVVPLSLINRIFVKTGIEEINKRKRVGIKALLDNISLNKVSSFEVGFNIAPRLNAAGRMDDAKKAVKLLITKNESIGRDLSLELELLNKKRQKLTELAFKESQIKIKKEYPKADSIVVADKKWHPGIVGIVAGRLVEKYKVPTVVLSIQNGKAIGSIRSIPSINVYEIIEKHSYLFERFGGHSLAVGLTISKENIEKFKQIFTAEVKKAPSYGEEAYIEVDMEVPLSYWSPEKVNQLKQLEPFGEGNPYPKFVARDLRLADFITVGNSNQHLKFWLEDGNKRAFQAVWWNHGDKLKKLSVGIYIDVVYTPKISNWNGGETVDFILNDIHISVMR
ncbi:MAG: single-stranded-DNA-specific exonuclease RecJ [Aquificae bacterium]|nr:single-stranded-DNA-specific exonuclease RecJ [Aquificota bacterium]